MYIIAAKYRWFFSIGVVFLISLVTLSLVRPTNAAVYTNPANPNIKYILDDGSQVYLEFPASWIAKDQGYSLLFTGNGASLEIAAYSPNSGGWFPSADTPIEQIANNIISESSKSPDANTKLVYHQPLTISNVPAYQLGYIQQADEPILVDNFILINGGYIYQIKYAAPQSLYDQDLPIRDKMIHSVKVGNSYNSVKAMQNEVDRTNQASLQIAKLNGQALLNNGLANSAMDNLVGGLHAQNEVAAQEHNKHIDGINDDFSDDVINKKGEVTNIGK